MIYAKNIVGRDFIVGDLHGNYSALMTLLEHVLFDQTVDRLFSVGDLVDRGPNSAQCLELISEPWFFPVLGNHEEMLIAAFNDPHHSKSIHGMNGGGWAYYPENVEVVHQYIDLVKALPHYIEVADSFSVMHAEPPYTKRGDLGSFHEDNWNTYECIDGQVTLWGRSWFYYFYGKDPKTVKKQAIPRSSKITTCYVGHSQVKSPVRLGFLVNLDTGSGKGGNLTLHCHTTNETFTCSKDNVVSNTEIWKIELCNSN